MAKWKFRHELLARHQKIKWKAAITDVMRDKMAKWKVCHKLVAGYEMVEREFRLVLVTRDQVVEGKLAVTHTPGQ